MRAESACLDDTLRLITSAAVDLVPGAEQAGIAVRTSGLRFESRAATGPLPSVVDALQREAGDGPCVESMRERSTVLVTDMRRESRWPAVSSESSTAGVGSTLVLCLYTDEVHGALHVHSSRAEAFDEHSIDVGTSLATHAAIALVASRQEEQLRDALASRDVIGQAKGMLMERFAVGADDAFVLLRKLSQERNVPLRRIAGHVVDAGGEVSTPVRVGSLPWPPGSSGSG
ncbi:GAF and ANTAR domain-containing protein [Rhodococcus sp. C26F]